MVETKNETDINIKNADEQKKFFRIELLPKEGFEDYKYHDVGELSGIKRVTGRKKDGSWKTQGWLVSKDFVHKQNNRLVADSEDAKQLFNSFKSKPIFIKENIYKTQSV